MDEFDSWLNEARARNASKKGFNARWIGRPLLFGLVQIMRLTQGIPNPDLRCSLRLIFCSYYTATLVGMAYGLLTLIALVALYIAIIIAVIAIGLVLVAFIFKGGLSQMGRRVGIESAPEVPREPIQREFKKALEKDHNRIFNPDKKTERLARLFGYAAQDIEVTNNGDILGPNYDITGERRKIGKIKEDGTIRDLRYLLGTPKIGEIDDEGDTRKKP
jgi:hypothetical protein